MCLANVTKEMRGVYSLTLTSNSGKVNVLRTVVDLKPDIFVVNRSELAANKGDDVTLDCSMDGMQAQATAKKRLWRHEQNILVSTSRVAISDNGETLNIQSANSNDSGTYSCAAVTDYGQDIVEFIVEVRGAHWNVSVDDCQKYSARISRIALLPSNESILAEWRIHGPDSLNASVQDCFVRSSSTGVATLWSNSSDSSAFMERTFDVAGSTGTIQLSDLTFNVGYYLQINFKSTPEFAPYVYGETRSFTLNQLEMDEGVNMAKSGTLTDTQIALAVTAGVALALLVLFCGVCLACKRRRRRHDLCCSCCCCCDESVGMVLHQGATMGKKKKKSSNLWLGNGLSHQDASAPYRGNLLQVAPVSPDDFMRNLAPQWPEPEPDGDNARMEEASLQHPDVVVVAAVAAEDLLSDQQELQALESNAFLRPPSGDAGQTNRSATNRALKGLGCAFVVIHRLLFWSKNLQ